LNCGDAKQFGGGPSFVIVQDLRHIFCLQFHVDWIVNGSRQCSNFFRKICL
jgi:hypothetical protein